MFRKSIMITLSVVLLLMSGCGGAKVQEEAQGTSESSNHEPITLQAYAYAGALNQDDFEKYVAAPVKAKFPYITLEYVPNGKGTSPKELLTASAMPDIIMTGLRQLINFQDLDVPVDLRELAKKHKLDISQYRQDAIEAITSYGTKGELYAVPFYVNFYAMLYNKDLFDRFSVPYPTDQMTWDEVKVLAAKLSRVQDGVTYNGMQPADTIETFGLGLSVPFIDEQTGRAKVATDEWKKVFEIAKEFNTIPGNEPKDAKNMYKAVDQFFKDKNIAMMPYFGTRLQVAAKSDAELGFNWDVVAFPSFKETPGKTAEVDAQVFALSKTSKYQDEAFNVIQYLTASEEVQSNFVKLGRALPSLKDDKLLKQFGEEYPVLKTKNVQSIFKSTTKTPHKTNKYDDLVRGKIKNAFAEHLSGLDINSALRKAEEEANKEIDALEKK
ncbi:extracellular solute-binding protein [Paenibacillus sp. RC67]|uniref:ABC transporter substrate-binding protein n=1 Tax=Paenibacillus sp. RC67 TaxID=3039392 RepID=UPI0024AD94FE|nr:extracellular solute-binding protein [Paenibacillus sp. RC67]